MLQQLPATELLRSVVARKQSNHLKSKETIRTLTKKSAKDEMIAVRAPPFDDEIIILVYKGATSRHQPRSNNDENSVQASYANYADFDLTHKKDYITSTIKSLRANKIIHNFQSNI